MPRQKKQHLKRRPDGRFACRYKDAWFYGATEEEALSARDDYKRKEAAKEYLGKRQTVQEYALEWLPLHKSDVSTKCYNDYAKQLEALFPFIGQKQLDSVTVDDAAKVWTHYAGYSASAVKRARMLFVGLFDSAIENDMCRKNPFRAKFAQPPKAPSGTHRVLTDAEIDLVRSVPHKMQTAAMIMLYAGLRIGEMLALEATDIDCKRKTITINKSIRFDNNDPVLTTTKTTAGKRIVPIPDLLLPYLKGLKGKPAGNEKGKALTLSAFRSAWGNYMRTLSETAKRQIKIRPHDLRHTYCTIIISAGIPIKQAMLWMGHADEKMILKVYDHITEQRTKDSTAKLNSMLSGSQNGSQTKKRKAKNAETTA